MCLHLFLFPYSLSFISNGGYFKKQKTSDTRRKWSSTLPFLRLFLKTFSCLMVCNPLIAIRFKQKVITLGTIIQCYLIWFWQLKQLRSCSFAIHHLLQCFHINYNLPGCIFFFHFGSFTLLCFNYGPLSLIHYFEHHNILMTLTRCPHKEWRLLRFNFLTYGSKKWNDLLSNNFKRWKY